MDYAIVEKATGKLFSTGTVVAEKLDPKFEVIELGENFKYEGLAWDEKSLTFVKKDDPTIAAFISALAKSPELSKLADIDRAAILTKVKNFIVRGEI